MIWSEIKKLFSESKCIEDTFKDEWREYMSEDVPLYSRLPEELRLLLHERIAGFVSSTRFEGCNGLEVTERMVITVAAQACMLVLNRDGEPYPNLRNVYLYPTTFSSVQKSRDALGVVTEQEIHRLGESWESGTVILAWDSVSQGARNIFDARNVTFHEFTHQLDHEDGITDGAPLLSSRQAYRSWGSIFRVNYTEFLEAVKSGKRTLIDDYGATNPAEFFAVATETFFEKPEQLRKKRPDLYEEMKGYYGVNPAEWMQ